MALAIIGGAPERFKPAVDYYREELEKHGHDPATPVSINSHGFLAGDSAAAAELAFPPFKETMDRIGRERGWPPTTRQRFDAERTLRGALFVGSPQEVIDKILYQHEIFHHDRFLIQLTVGPMPHADVLRAIELLGTEVAPVVRRELGGAAPEPAGESEGAGSPE
jgi:alkanesulfonate monooxygenase SsuD/methylene tetrahydromethanopterin reductase-like flavin-dependent oxidoreductase (luciferase family)